MTSRTFRRIALGLDQVVEGSHMGHPDFRAANGRVFASLIGNTGSVALTPDEQQRCLAECPAAFAPASGAWGRQGWTTIALAEADEERVGEALTLAWRRIAAAAPSRRRPAAARRTRA